MRDYRNDPRSRKFPGRIWVTPDETYFLMYRVLANGTVSDLTNITRAVDAARALSSEVQ
jgi:hypothetical protein